MANTVHERNAAAALDRLRHRPARPYVVDHLLAGSFREHGVGEESGDEVAGDERALVVDEEAPVCVAVVGDSEVGALLLYLRDDELAVLGKEWVGLVVREAPVRLEVAADDLELGKPLEDGRQHHACHAVGGVEDDAERVDGIRVDERQDLRDEGRPYVLVTDAPRAGRRRSPPRRARDLGQPESPPTGSAPRRTIFIPEYSFGLCEAVTQIPPSRPSSATAWYSISVPTSPSRTTSTPASAIPSTPAAYIAGDDTRMSCPRATARGSNCSA